MIVQVALGTVRRVGPDGEPAGPSEPRTLLTLQTPDGLMVQATVTDEEADNIERSFATVREQRVQHRTGLHLPNGTPPLPS